MAREMYWTTLIPPTKLPLSQPCYQGWLVNELFWKVMKLNVVDPNHSTKEMKNTNACWDTKNMLLLRANNWSTLQADLPTFDVGNKERSSLAFPSPTKIDDAQFGLPWSHCNQIVDHGRKTWAGHPCMGGSAGQCLKSGDWGGAEGCLFQEHPHSKGLG